MSAGFTPGAWGKDPSDPFVVARYIQRPTNADCTAQIAALFDALGELVGARGLNPNLVVGQHPTTGHPLNAEGMAAVKAEIALGKALGSELALVEDFAR